MVPPSQGPERVFPVNELPMELLIAIFLAFLEEDENPAFLIIYLRGLLARVCQKWRNIVYDTPGFWAHLHITRCTRPEFVRACIGRAKQAHLTVHFDLMSYRHLPVASSMYPTGSKMHRVECMPLAQFRSRTLSQFYEVLHRVSTLSMECPDNMAWIDFTNDLGGSPAGILTDMRIAVLFQSAVYPAAGVQSFGGSTNIHHLCLTSVTPLWANTAVYASLTILRLSTYRRLHWTALRDVLLAAPNLITLQLAEVDLLGVDSADAITLPLVKNFGLNLVDQGTLSVLSVVKLPSVVCLRIRTYGDQVTISDAFVMQKDLFRRARVIQIAAHRDEGLGDIHSVMEGILAAEEVDFSECNGQILDKLLLLAEAGDLALSSVKVLTSPGVLCRDEAERLLRSAAFDPSCALVSGMKDGHGNAWVMRNNILLETEYRVKVPTPWRDHFGGFIEAT